MTFRSALSGAVIALFVPSGVRAEDPPAVSYYKDVRPIFQQHCQGCHQPAKPQGGYVMTDARRPAQGRRARQGRRRRRASRTTSYLVEQITLATSGKAEMPKGRDPLNADPGQADRRLDRAGGEGRHARQREGRRRRRREPAEVLRPAGRHRRWPSRPTASCWPSPATTRCCCYKADGYELASRLIGLSERVQSVAFSPDGKRLAAVGGVAGPVRRGAGLGRREARSCSSPPRSRSTRSTA